jgi:outer membrane protein OmpA-like peptidoglycan-associated protein
MPEDDPSKSSTPSPSSSSSGLGMVLFVVAGLALLFGAVVLGRNLSRPTSMPAVSPKPSPDSATPSEKKGTVSSAERQEVLKRIDLMPNVTAEAKERLYTYVDRAQNLQRLMTISFDKGRTRLSDKEVARVVKESRQMAFAKMIHDPSAIFVVLGYSDTSGDEKKNMPLSTSRATSVMELLRKQCGVQNVIQTVPMGNPPLDARDAAENRVAEIWTLLP